MSAKISLILAMLCLAGALLVAACGGGGGGAGGQPNLGKIPTATAYAVLPEPTILAGGVPVTQGGGGDTYVVAPGDTLMSIADELGVAVEDLISLNDLADPSHLEVDQVLKVPRRSGASPTAIPSKQPTGQATQPTRQATGVAAAGSGTYEVESGDNAADIAARFGVTLQELADANHTTINELRSLVVGQVLTIPGSTGHTPVPTSTSEPEATATEAPTETPETTEATATPVEDTGGAAETATP